MGKMSRDKGKRGEREVVDLFKARGFTAHRSAQVDGSLSSDVLVDEAPNLHVEVKRYAKIGSMRFLDQAIGDAPSTKIPVVFMREDEGSWGVLVRAETFLHLLSVASGRTE